MPRTLHDAIRDVVNLSRHFVQAENVLFERLPGEYLYCAPVHCIERDLATGACGFFQFHRECKALLAEPGTPQLQIGLERALGEIPELIKTRLRHWHWEFILKPNGMKSVLKRLDAHVKAKEYPLLDAALSCARSEGGAAA